MADNSLQTQLRELQAQVTALTESLAEQGDAAAGRLRKRTSAAMRDASRTAEEVADYARSEAESVAGIVREHPAATSTALLTAGLIGGLLGYLIGASQAPHHPHHRWY
ncbi:MAG: hypothetical protein H5U22_04065 [Rhizobium sp.]|nr:hypothetical protein [Rhizobium sp.]